MNDEFEKKYNGTWNCIVGPPTFASQVSYGTGRYIWFELGEERILLFGKE
jgi:hypothetical protein